MQTTTLSFENMHNYGVLFSNLLRARRESFIVERKWNLPETMGMEFDQYDTPLSRWIAIHEGGQILAGFRLTPTTAQCGVYSYMIRDAQRGLLDTIPSELLFEDAPVAPHIHEISRFFVASHLPARVRFKVQAQLLKALLDTRDTLEVKSVIGLGPKSWNRWLRTVGHTIVDAGPLVEIEGTDNQCHLMHLKGAYH